MQIKRGMNKSICPSEVARALLDENWRDHILKIREVAHELFIDGKIDITQKNLSVGINYTGPIRLRSLKIN